MRKTGVAEWALKRAAGAERGAGIYGDLMELAAGRGRVWFWAEYAWTLVALTWRTPAAVMLGGAMFTAMYRLWIWSLGMELHYLRSHHHRNGNLFSHPYLFGAILWIAFELWFMLPYFAVRYGMRDRLVRLTFATALVFSGACSFLFIPRIAIGLAALGLLPVLGSFCLAGWRGAGITLTSAVSAGAAALYALFFVTHIAAWYYMKHGFGRHFELFSLGFALPRTLFWTVEWSIVGAEMLLLAMLSAWLHRRFVDGKQVATA